MTTNQCLTDGGLPDDWTRQNLAWLAQAHRHFCKDTYTAKHGLARSDWHRRWAAFIEDVLETHRGKNY